MLQYSSKGTAVYCTTMLYIIFIIICQANEKNCLIRYDWVDQYYLV